MATSKKKKPLDIRIDTKNVDVTLQTDGEGNAKATLDTKVVDVEFTKDAEGVHLDIHLDDDKEYEFESNGKSSTLPKGVWKVSAEFARIFLKQGLGKLKK